MTADRARRAVRDLHVACDARSVPPFGSTSAMVSVARSPTRLAPLGAHRCGPAGCRATIAIIALEGEPLRAQANKERARGDPRRPARRGRRLARGARPAAHPSAARTPWSMERRAMLEAHGYGGAGLSTRTVQSRTISFACTAGPAPALIRLVCVSRRTRRTRAAPRCALTGTGVRLDLHGERLVGRRSGRARAP